MTERYALYQTDEVPERFQVSNGLSRNIKKRYNIAPGQAAVVVVSRAGERQLELMKWGFVPPGAKDMNSIFRYKTYSVRSEQVFEKNLFKEAIRHRRCLVPASGFYEWHRADGVKKPYYIQLNDQKPFSLAGIYSDWVDKDGKQQSLYSVITTEANQEMSAVSERMPLILQPQDEADWLDDTKTEAGMVYDLMRPYSDDTLLIHEVSDVVNGTKVDTVKLINPLS